MHRGVAPRGPARTHADIKRVVHIADKNGRCCGRDRRCRAGILGVTTQTKVGIALRQQLCVDRTMRCVTDGAAFAQRGVLENERPGLFAMTLGAGLVGARHGQTAGRFENIAAMRVMALRAAHVLLD